MATVFYSLHMLTVKLTPVFKKWLDSLKDQKAIDKITSRLILMGAGSFGDVKPCGEGLSESRIHYGAGYRIYFIQHGKTVIVVLGGGTKKTQSQDIKKAKDVAKERKFL
ncbi:MAG: type II toxin-antitoxin system RelE/ParE family toxin [Zymomonas mobilis subsp. pomaceae]|uniref:type II toxin-antitoxin system RelE/ParE family toxin n=2 Tax=Zymomonas mobilis TaxID=542 RepID=UPI0001B705FA|nr:addiction module killer protein [Zymomonas mobilis subsp. mobilis NCIMB 11163]